MARRKHDPPEGLSKQMTAFWQKIHEEYVLEGHHERLLEMACRAWDRAEEARAVLDKEGLVYLDRFRAPRSRPECKIENDARTQFRVTLREIGLDHEVPEDTRPPRIGGQK